MPCINQNYNEYVTNYLEDRKTPVSSFIFINYLVDNTKYQAVFAKELASENDLNSDNLYLIHHSKVDLVNQVDGIFTKTECLVFLERFLNRWRYTANQVLLVVPFIGYQYPNSREGVLNLWTWLNTNINIEKTNLVTRKGTYKLFKNANPDHNILVEWGLIDKLGTSMEENKMPYLERSHAKYYVGIFDDYVEVISGSFNIHQGNSHENLTFRRYKKSFFETRYLHMFKNQSYYSNKKETQDYVHYMEFNSGQYIKQGACDLNIVLTKMEEFN